MAILGEWVAGICVTSCTSTFSGSACRFSRASGRAALITRVSADTDRLWEFLAFGIVDVSLSLVQLAGLSTVLLSLDWRLGLVMTCRCPCSAG